MLLTAAILGIFVVLAVLMYLQKLPALLALPIMAIGIALVAGIPRYDILKVVITDGAVRLAGPISAAIFGAALAQVVNTTGIAETIIKKAAELAGDRPLVVSLVLTFATALLFTSVGGLGAVIMVGTIVFPIMLSLGVPNRVAAGLLLLGISLGGCFNLGNWKFYLDTFGVKADQVAGFAAYLGLPFVVMIVAFAAISLRKGVRVLWSVSRSETRTPSRRIHPMAMLTPVVPLLIVIGVAVHNKLAGPANELDLSGILIPALLAGVLYGLLTTKTEQGRIGLLTKSFFLGIADVAPAIVLMIGIGMLLKVFEYSTPNPDSPKLVYTQIEPVLRKLVPASQVPYVLVFGLLAPLALYRGPLNTWGMGVGVAALLKGMPGFPAMAAVAMLFSVGQVQGICDPTNTQNVWAANFLGVDTNAILRKTLPYAWILALIGLSIGAVLYFR